MPRKRPAGLPSRKQILDFIATSDQPAGKREIARAFGLSGQAKIELKALLKDMADEGLIDSAPAALSTSPAECRRLLSSASSMPTTAATSSRCRSSGTPTDRRPAFE